MSRATWFSNIESKLKRSGSDITRHNFELSLGALVSDLTSRCHTLKCQLWVGEFHKVGFTVSRDSPIPIHTNYVLFYRLVSAECSLYLSSYLSNPALFKTSNTNTCKHFLTSEHKLALSKPLSLHLKVCESSPLIWQDSWHSANSIIIFNLVSKSNILTSVQTKPFVLVSVFYQMVLPQINTITTALFS